MDSWTFLLGVGASYSEYGYKVKLIMNLNRENVDHEV